LSDKTDSQSSSSHALLFFVAGTLAGAAAVVLFLPEARKKARSLAQETVEGLREGEIRTEMFQTEHQTKKALKAGWEAFINTLTENPSGPSSPHSEE
jgi:gas vesicle protein